MFEGTPKSMIGFVAQHSHFVKRVGTLCREAASFNKIAGTNAGWTSQSIEKSQIVLNHRPSVAPILVVRCL